MMQGIAVLGSTGSIGRQTLKVIDDFPEQLHAFALVAGTNVELLAEQIHKYQPKIAVIAEENLLSSLKNLVNDTKTILLAGEAGITEAIGLSEVATVVAAISGAAGLASTLQAIDFGKKVALANKETLVMAGHIVMESIKNNRSSLLPIDSEHSAIFQCISNQKKYIDSIVLTASGGPFRGWTSEQLHNVTPKMALRHPNWSMGSKITVDSATLINKGLEVIEAHWLFDIPYSQIEVVVHPQSIIHSMVRFKDTSIIAQMGYPDMRLPILYALTWPERWETTWGKIDFFSIPSLTFERPNLNLFPGLKLAYEVGVSGGTAPTIYNAANEKAVELFLNYQIPFNKIVELIKFCLHDMVIIQNPSLSEIIEIDLLTREKVAKKAKSLTT